MPKEYFEKEVELLIKGTPIRVKGMPSRIKREVIIDPKGKAKINWYLAPARVNEIKDKWVSIKASHGKEIEEAKMKKKKEEG